MGASVGGTGAAVASEALGEVAGVAAAEGESEGEADADADGEAAPAGSSDDGAHAASPTESAIAAMHADARTIITIADSPVFRR
jgi:hypothetical protein